MDKKKIVELAYHGYIDFSDDEFKIVIDLNTFDEEIKEYLCSKHSDDEDYVYYNDEEYDDLVSELNNMLIKMFKDNGYVVYSAGDIYAGDGKFETVACDTNVAIKEHV